MPPTPDELSEAGTLLLDTFSGPQRAALARFLHQLDMIIRDVDARDMQVRHDAIRAMVDVAERFALASSIRTAELQSAIDALHAEHAASLAELRAALARLTAALEPS